MEGPGQGIAQLHHTCRAWWIASAYSQPGQRAKHSKASSAVKQWWSATRGHSWCMIPGTALCPGRAERCACEVVAVVVHCSAAA